MTSSTNSASPRSPDAVREQAQTKASLIGFYLSCAGVALGTAFAGGGYLWFEKTWALVAGITVTVVSSITCYTSLKKMRR